MTQCEILLNIKADELKEALLQRMREAVASAVAAEGIERAELCISIVNNADIQTLNREFRGKDVPTDVLSFPANELTQPLAQALANGFLPEYAMDGSLALGDIAISIETARAQAEAYGNTLADELRFLAVHGALHLLGYDHELPEDETVMRQKQREALGRT